MSDQVQFPAACKPDSAWISRFATLWIWEEGPIIEGGKHRRYFWERLRVKVSRNARPYCCYLNTVIFYDHLADGRRELARCETYGFSAGSPHLLCDKQGHWWEAGGGRVQWSHGHWWMVWSAWDNSRAARMMNAGFPTYR